MVHLALAGGDELAEANALAAREQQFAAAVTSAGATDPHYASDLALLRDLSARLATVRQSASSAVSSVLSLKAGGFPGNRSTILAARATLTQLRTPEGALGIAQGDEREIARDLGLAL